MEIVHEVTARLENKPGRLAKVCSALAHEKINVRALAVMDATERSVLRFVADQLDQTKRVLTSLGVEYEMHDVLAVELEDRPGSVARVLERLAAEHINIEYAYVSASNQPGRSLGIFMAENLKKAQQVLHDASHNGAVRDPGRRPLHSR